MSGLLALCLLLIESLEDLVNIAIIPVGETEFRAGDRLTFPGTEEKIEELREKYRKN